MDESGPHDQKPGPVEAGETNDSSGSTGSTGSTGEPAGGRHGVRTWQIVVGVVVLVAMATAIGVVIGRRTQTTAQVSTETTETTSLATTTTASSPSATVPADAGTWSLIPGGPTAAGTPMAWTGTQLLVARAGCCDDLGSADLAGYDPATNTWRQLPPTPLTPRAGAAGAWTGTEMVVAGGVASPDGTHEHAAPVADGAAWDAASNQWRPIAPMPTPAVATATVWTGHEVLVLTQAPDPVLAYNPATDTWRSLPSSGLSPRQGAVVVWTGTELVVWGGVNGGYTASFGDGARLDPATSTWRPLPPAPVPARGDAAYAWSGHEMLLWGGDTGAGQPGKDLVGQGAAYNPATDTWRALALSPLRAKSGAAGAWTGRFFVVIGGGEGFHVPVPGPGSAAYDPLTDTWTVLPTAVPFPPLTADNPNGPTGPADQRVGGVAFWSGTAVLLIGGDVENLEGPLSDGLAWTPAG